MVARSNPEAGTEVAGNPVRDGVDVRVVLFGQAVEHRQHFVAGAGVACGIDDRIRVYEGRPQRYGTQLHLGPSGVLEPHPIENESRVNSMRMQAGLPPLQRTLEAARAQPQPSREAELAREAAELEFRRSVGWIN